MTILPKIRVQYGELIGNEVFVQFPDLRSHEQTYLEADVASGASSITANGVNFSIGQYVIVGQPGSEKTEIIRIHASTAPTSTAITLASALSFAHNRGDLVRFIPYNQIVVERSTDAGVSFSALSAIDIRADASETYLQRPSDSSTDVYQARFKNSSDTTYSQYSATYTASGIGDNTFGSIKRRALNELSEKSGDQFNDEFLLGALKEARREVDEDPRVMRFSFRTKMNTDIGDIIPGRWSLTAPTDLRDPNTPQHILGIRLGRNGTKLVYQDVNRFFQNYRGVAHSTLNGSITTISTSIILTSSGDFDESGNIDIAAESISAVVDNVNYTTNTETTNTLGTVTNIGANHASGRDVWQGASFGEPYAYTIIEGTIYFNQPFDDSLAGENVYMDYYQKLQDVTNDSTELDEPSYDMYVDFLKFKIKDKKAQGRLDPKTDPSFLGWATKKERFITQQSTGQFGYVIPS